MSTPLDIIHFYSLVSLQWKKKNKTNYHITQNKTTIQPKTTLLSENLWMAEVQIPQHGIKMRSYHFSRLSKLLRRLCLFNHTTCFPRPAFTWPISQLWTQARCPGAKGDSCWNSLCLFFTWFSPSRHYRKACSTIRFLWRQSSPQFTPPTHCWLNSKHFSLREDSRTVLSHSSGQDTPVPSVPTPISLLRYKSMIILFSS